MVMFKMVTWSHLFVVLVCTNFIVKLGSTENAICPQLKSYIAGGRILYYNETVCCDNFELRANKCIECDFGFYRPVDRTPEPAICIPCEGGFYGKKCAFFCNCHTNERCTANKGCVSNMSNDKATDEQTTTVSKSTTFEENKDQSTKFTDMTSVTIASIKVSMKYNYIKVYIACTGSLAFLITVAVVCRKWIQKLKTSTISKKKRIQPYVRNVQEQHEIFNFQDNGNVYNIIEERNMIDI